MNEREQGREDVLKFIREGRFLHDEAPPAQFAREIEAGWNAHGKAAADKAIAEEEEKPVRFRMEIEAVINRFSMENGSDTPDFILAEFLADCLTVFDKTTRAREQWYGRGKEPVTPATKEELDAILNAPEPATPVEITRDGRVVRSQVADATLDTRSGRAVRDVADATLDAKLHPERYFNPETGDRDF